MTKKEMIELYSDILGKWKDNIEKQRKECGASADETVYVDASFVTDMLKDFIDSLSNMEVEEKAYELTGKSLEVGKPIIEKADYLLNGFEVKLYKCPRCQTKWKERFNFCPECGLDWRESEVEE